MLFLILIIIYYFSSNLIEYWRLNYNDIIDLKKNSFIWCGGKSFDE